MRFPQPLLCKLNQEDAWHWEAAGLSGECVSKCPQRVSIPIDSVLVCFSQTFRFPIYPHSGRSSGRTKTHRAIRQKAFEELVSYAFWHQHCSKPQEPTRAEWRTHGPRLVWLKVLRRPDKHAWFSCGGTLNWDRDGLGFQEQNQQNMADCKDCILSPPPIKFSNLQNVECLLWSTNCSRQYVHRTPKWGCETPKHAEKKMHHGFLTQIFELRWEILERQYFVTFCDEQVTFSKVLWVTSNQGHLIRHVAVRFSLMIIPFELRLVVQGFQVYNLSELFRGRLGCWVHSLCFSAELCLFLSLAARLWDFFQLRKWMRCCQMSPTESFKVLPGCSTVATCSSDELLRMYLKMHSEGEFCEEVEWIEDRRRYVIMSS